MEERLKIKREFKEESERIFDSLELQRDSLAFSIKFSLLVEEYIVRILRDENIEIVVASTGSFSRRELSPFSDIDLMLIAPKITQGLNKKIQNCITLLWDCGIEASHTVREYSDIKKFLKDDIQAYTQFFETRFLLGDKKIYDEWVEKVKASLDKKNRDRLFNVYFEDNKLRHEKYGRSPKVLEPNIKYSNGGLRDLHAAEWIYCVINNVMLTDQRENTQTECFLEYISNQNIISKREAKRVLQSFKILQAARNNLHLLSKRKNDRLEFLFQDKIAHLLEYGGDAWSSFMHDYFEASGNISRFYRSMVKKYYEQITRPIADEMGIKLDEDFILKGDIISHSSDKPLSISDIMRAFYYRGKYDARFSEPLRSVILLMTEDQKDEMLPESESSVFFREILKLEKCVARTLFAMNELQVLGLFIPEFKDMVGFFQPGVYHCYTADEHTLIAIKNLEKLNGDESKLGLLFGELEEKDLLYMSVLMHDIAKPISVSGHEILGAEIAETVMTRLGYSDEEITKVKFIVKHHLTMEKVAFRRNLSDASTLNAFAEVFPSHELLDILYLMTYADLSAVNPVVWTQWKSQLLSELYYKTKSMLIEKRSGEEFLIEESKQVMEQAYSDDEDLKNHLESINDLGYIQSFSQDEILSHLEEIEKGSDISVFFKEENGFTNITVITYDSESLLSRLCGTLSINDLNIHDAKIFTRKDGVVIDSFNVTDFRTHTLVDPARYEKIEADLRKSIENLMQINQEFSNMKSKWWRLESRFFKRKGKIKINFEDHEKFTIIDVFSPDRLGLLYTITHKMNELGLSIYFAKIATRGDDVVDAFYILDRNGNKVLSHDMDLIKIEITKAIKELL